MRRHAAILLRLKPVLLAVPVICSFLPDALAATALLRNGRSLSVTDFRREGDRIVLVMEGGGQIALLQEQVVAIRRDQPAETAARPAPVVPQASQDGTSMSPPAQPVLEIAPVAGAG